MRGEQNFPTLMAKVVASIHFFCPLWQFCNHLPYAVNDLICASSDGSSYSS